MTVDKNPQSSRIKIKYPDGFEIEIEGSREFVEKEKMEILSMVSKISQNTTKDNINKALSQIIDFTQNTPFIKIKNPDLDEKMAILIIILAFEKLAGIEQPSALNISRAARLSGYYIKRLDLVAIDLIKDGSVKAFGTKRNRRYELTEKGKAKAELKIANLTQKP